MPESGAREAPATSASRAGVERKRAVSASAATQSEAISTVRLVDLEVIKRYSLAVRRDAVPADELLAALDASRDTVIAAMGTPATKRTAKTKVTEAEATRASRKLA